MTYNVKYTNLNKAPIEVASDSVNNSASDISLPGREHLDYGADMNAALLHILENFACYEDPLAINFPDLTTVSTVGGTTKRLLQTPVQGQLWFNKTKSRICVWDGESWSLLASEDDVGLNWGTVSHGEQLPLPSGFTYSECVWIVSPAPNTGAFEYMQCYTDAISTVTMAYGQSGGGEIYGDVNFTIVGIRGNNNYGYLLNAPQPSPSPTPVYVTPTPTPTISVTASTAVTPTPTVTTTPAGGATLTPTPTPEATPTPTVTPTPSSAVLVGGALTPFGDFSSESYGVSGNPTIGFTVNGLTGVVAMSQESTRLTARLETGSFDVGEDFWVDYGTVLGDEPSAFGTDYWVYVVCIPPSTKFTSNTGNFNQWVNIGTSFTFFGGVTKTLASPSGFFTISRASINGSVYMKNSPTMPIGNYSVGTFMGTFVVAVNAGVAP